MKSYSKKEKTWVNWIDVIYNDILRNRSEESSFVQLIAPDRITHYAGRGKHTAPFFWSATQKHVGGSGEIWDLDFLMVIHEQQLCIFSGGSKMSYIVVMDGPRSYSLFTSLVSMLFYLTTWIPFHSSRTTLHLDEAKERLDALIPDEAGGINMFCDVGWSRVEEVNIVPEFNRS